MERRSTLNVLVNLGNDLVKWRVASDESINCSKRIADIVSAGFFNQSIRSKECREFHRFVGSASHQRASWPS